MEGSALSPPISGILSRLLDPVEGMGSYPAQEDPGGPSNQPIVVDPLLVETQANPDQKAELALELVRMCLHRGEIGKALDLLALALRGAEERRNPGAEVQVLVQLGEIRALQGYQQEAETYLKLALERAFGVGAPLEATQALGILGRLALRRHAYEAAIEYVHQGLALLDNLDPPRPFPKAYLLALRGAAYGCIGFLEDCIISYYQVLEVLEFAKASMESASSRTSPEDFLHQLRSINAQWEIKAVQSLAARVQTNLGLLLLYRGDLYASYAYLQSGLAAHRELGDRHAEGCALAGLSRCAFLLGRLSEAKAYTQMAVDLLGPDAPRDGADRGRLEFLQAMIAEAEGDRVIAVSHLRKAVEIFSTLGLARDLAAAYLALGRLLLEGGEVEAAAAILHQALETLQGIAASPREPPYPP